jgi:hypothetical protein
VQRQAEYGLVVIAHKFFERGTTPALRFTYQKRVVNPVLDSHVVSG